MIMSAHYDRFTLMNNLTKEEKKMDKVNEAIEALQNANKVLTEMFGIDEENN